MSRNTFDFKKIHGGKNIISSVGVGQNFGRGSFFLVKITALISFVLIF